MHVVDYLADPKCEGKPKNALSAEYRLLCSGTLYHDCLGDWSKSEGARLLLADPLRLFVVSRPFDDYPLELSLHVNVPFVEETEQTKAGIKSIVMSHHNDEVANDLAALLSLLCRRLITVAGMANARYQGGDHVAFGSEPTPMPLATSMRRVFWPRHPSTIITWPDRQEIQDHNPRPKALYARKLTDILLGLAKIQHAEAVVTSCRLYALALELIHERPDIAYPLLISSAETMANATLAGFQPSDKEMVRHQKPVYDMALDLGLREEAAKSLAIKACQREWWATRKFKNFLMDNVAESFWTEKDELFHRMPEEGMPKREDFERSLSKIYEARSKASHEGKPFPVTATYTGGPHISMRAGRLLFGEDAPFPPVVWFERVVNSAIAAFWERSVMQA